MSKTVFFFDASLRCATTIRLVTTPAALAYSALANADPAFLWIEAFPFSSYEPMPHPSGLRSANSLNAASSLPGFSGDELHIVKSSHVAYFAILSALIPNSFLRRTISPSGTTGFRVSSTAKTFSQIGHLVAFIAL
jgi:hypothetical protein